MCSRCEPPPQQQQHSVPLRDRARSRVRLNMNSAVHPPRGWGWDRPHGRQPLSGSRGVPRRSPPHRHSTVSAGCAPTKRTRGDQGSVLDDRRLYAATCCGSAECCVRRNRWATEGLHQRAPLALRQLRSKDGTLNAVAWANARTTIIAQQCVAHAARGDVCGASDVAARGVASSPWQVPPVVNSCINRSIIALPQPPPRESARGCAVGAA